MCIVLDSPILVCCNVPLVIVYDQELKEDGGVSFHVNVGVFVSCDFFMLRFS